MIQISFQPLLCPKQLLHLSSLLSLRLLILGILSNTNLFAWLDISRKLLSKVLASCLKKVIGRLVSLEQSDFIPGRSIYDGVLVVNELLDFAKRSKRDYMVMKIDFERSYDYVNWDFLRYLFVR